jgi:hypothetical protein
VLLKFFYTRSQEVNLHANKSLSCFSNRSQLRQKVKDIFRRVQTALKSVSSYSFNAVLCYTMNFKYILNKTCKSCHLYWVIKSQKRSLNIDRLFIQSTRGRGLISLGFIKKTTSYGIEKMYLHIPPELHTLTTSLF